MVKKILVNVLLTEYRFNKSVWVLFCSLYPHLFSRAYINFKNPEDIVLFRDRFDGYVFIDNKGKALCTYKTRHFYAK